MRSKKLQRSARSILAQNLRTERRRLGISQEKLAELAELHRTYIGSVERCERNISVDNIELLAKALHITVSALLDENEK